MSVDTQMAREEARDECLIILKNHCRVLYAAADLATPVRARQLLEARKQLFDVARQIRRKLIP